MRLTIATPAAHIDIANNYAMALGYSEADGLTYRNPYGKTPMVTSTLWQAFLSG